jgi:cytosine/adenosine deaminase-related metal-dependent hydrolase
LRRVLPRSTTTISRGERQSGPALVIRGGSVIDARSRIVLPDFIDTHHHQFEPALRSFLADWVLINDGSGTPNRSITCYESILLNFASVCRPQNVYISELVGGLSRLGDGVTTVHDVSRSTTRRSIPTPPSRHCLIPDAGRHSAISKAPVRVVNTP